MMVATQLLTASNANATGQIEVNMQKHLGKYFLCLLPHFLHQSRQQQQKILKKNFLIQNQNWTFLARSQIKIKKTPKNSQPMCLLSESEMMGENAVLFFFLCSGE